MTVSVWLTLQSHVTECMSLWTHTWGWIWSTVSWRSGISFNVWAKYNDKMILGISYRSQVCFSLFSILMGKCMWRGFLATILLSAVLPLPCVVPAVCAHSCAQPSTELTCDPLPDDGLLLGNPHPPSLTALQLGSNLEPAVFEAMHHVLCGVCCSWLWTITQAIGQSSHWEWDSCVLKNRRESVGSVYLCIYSSEPLYHSAYPFWECRGAMGWDRRLGQEKHMPACPACKEGRWLHPERSATLGMVGASDRSRLW